MAPPSVPTKPLNKLTVAELKQYLKERELEQTVCARGSQAQGPPQRCGAQKPHARLQRG
jgi:hypothetical protein